MFVRQPLSAAEGAEWNFEVRFKSAVRIYRALQMDGTGQDPSKLPIGIEFRDGDSYPTLWDLNARYPRNNKLFQSLMSNGWPFWAHESVVDGFDWNQVNSLVDVGALSDHTIFWQI